MPLYAVRCVGKKEKYLIDAIENNVRSRGLPVKAVVYIPEIKGYIFVEADDENTVREAIAGNPYSRGMISKPINPDELKHFFEEKEDLVLLKEGDIVEIIGGPLKRDKAKIISIDYAKKEARVEIIDSSTPIPLTMKLELLKKINE